MKILISLSVLVVVMGFVYCFSCTNTMRDSAPMESGEDSETAVQEEAGEADDAESSDSEALFDGADEKEAPSDMAAPAEPAESAGEQEGEGGGIISGGAKPQEKCKGLKGKALKRCMKKWKRQK